MFRKYLYTIQKNLKTVLNNLIETVLLERIEKIYATKKENILLIGPNIDYVQKIANKYESFFSSVIIFFKRLHFYLNIFIKIEKELIIHIGF